MTSVAVDAADDAAVAARCSTCVSVGLPNSKAPSVASALLLLLLLAYFVFFSIFYAPGPPASSSSFFLSPENSGILGEEPPGHSHRERNKSVECSECG